MVDVVLSGGARGYGKQYLDELLIRAEQRKLRIAGVVDPVPFEEERTLELKKLNIPLFASLNDFYQEGHQADLAIISSPIQYHCEQACLAMENGSHVLVEKPVAPTMEQLEQMIEKRDQCNKMVGVGYQWAFTQAIQALKRDILEGTFGKPVRLKTIVLWPRDFAYYGRNSWAGKLKDREERWVLDSVAANATAHFLQNMFFILGDAMNTSALPEKVVAEAYRANSIENFDTCAIRAYTQDNTEVLYIATHAVAKREQKGPVFEYEFEKATIRFGSLPEQQEQTPQGIHALFKDGSVKKYGYSDNHFNKIDVMVESIESGKDDIPCGLETASAHTLCIHAIHQSVKDIPTFAPELITNDQEQQMIYVDGLAAALRACYLDWQLPHEAQLPWAKAGALIELSKDKKQTMK
jgi:predicted dehydrogenase